MPSQSIIVDNTTTTNNNNIGTNLTGVRYKRNQDLVKNMSIVSCATLVLLLVQLTDSIFLPPRLFYIPFHYNHHTHPVSSESNQIGVLAEDTVKSVPYQLTINEGSSISVELNSRAALTVNLNRAVPLGVTVLLSVYSGPNLISFDKNQNSTQLQYSSKVVQNNSSTSYSINFPANTFGDQVVYFHTDHSAGHAEIVCKVLDQPRGNITIDDSSAYISVDIYRRWDLNIVIQVVGWIYFFAWSISFYFQFDLNYRRKSVVGLNFDFMALNLFGFTCYAIYNSTLLFSYAVQQEYYKRYTFSRIPVEYNDLFFSWHAVLLTLLTVMQCFFYERGEQKVSLPSTLFLGLASILGIGLYIASLFKGVSILDVVFYLSYVKLAITTIKYGPQAYMNYRRKATTGWSIHNIILDFTGGSFSFLQMLLIAYNYNDWISIFGNFAKFGLGLVSMIFDVVFLTQHYVLYANERPLMSGNDLENSSESVPSPVISQSIRSANATQQQQHQAEDSDTTTD